MGFIERLREELERKRIEQTAIERNKVQRDIEEQQQKQHLHEASKRKWNEVVNESNKYVNQSNFPRLIRELASVVPGAKADGDTIPFHSVEEYYKYERSDEKYYPKGVQLKMQWDHEKKGFDNYDYMAYKYIEIKFYPNGNIRVEGGLFGSTNLSFEKWKGNPEAQEKALEKAFKNPARFSCNDPHQGFSYGPM
jgi:hypothetical protein